MRMCGHAISLRTLPTCGLSACRYVDMMQVSATCWRKAENAFDRSMNGRRALTAKLRRDAAANAAKTTSTNLERSVSEMLAEIDFEEIADNSLATFHGYRRRKEDRTDLQKTRSLERR
jgi:hypothetical protein